MVRFEGTYTSVKGQELGLPLHLPRTATSLNRGTFEVRFGIHFLVDSKSKHSNEKGFKQIP
jgi:hypothetical protein